jgi:hypothetical protein
MSVSVTSTTLSTLSTLNPAENKIYEALQTMHIGKCSNIEVAEHLKTCIQLSGAVPPTNPEFQFLVDFIIKNYGIFKLKELGAAFELYVLGRLDVERNYGSFSPKFFGDVMNEYKKIAVQVRQKVEPKLETTVPQSVIDEEQAIKDEIEWWDKSKKDWQMINHTIFDYLWKRKLIKLTKEEADSIKERVRISILGKAIKPSEVLISDEQMKTLAKKYSLMLYFNTL